jgi:small subunit ribosomal protein S12
MPTNKQLLKNSNYRIVQYTKDRKRALEKCPQKKGVCLKVYVTSPKKPNSAKRKVTKILLSNSIKVIAYIDGIGHTLQKHGSVLIRGGRRRDLPGVRYRTIRGKFDLNIEPVLRRGSKRSKYGQRIFVGVGTPFDLL